MPKFNESAEYEHNSGGVPPFKKWLKNKEHMKAFVFPITKLKVNASGDWLLAYSAELFMAFIHLESKQAEHAEEIVRICEKNGWGIVAKWNADNKSYISLGYDEELSSSMQGDIESDGLFFHYTGEKNPFEPILAALSNPPTQSPVKGSKAKGRTFAKRKQPKSA